MELVFPQSRLSLCEFYFIFPLIGSPKHFETGGVLHLTMAAVTFWYQS